jgi:hypothetical protein
MENFTVRPDGTLVLMNRGLSGQVQADPRLQGRIADVPGASAGAVVVDTDSKFLLTRNGTTWDNPWGEALLSRLWWPWFFRQNAWNYYGQYLERFAIPMLVGTGEDMNMITAALAKAQQDAVIAVHTGDQVTALNANGSGHELYARAEEMLVRRIEKVILGQTLTSGTDGGSGNRALGQVHNAVREDKTKSDIELVRPTVQRFVDACFRLNGMRGDPPEVVFGDDRQLSTERAQRDATLKQSGIVKGFSLDYILDNYGFRPGEVEMPDEPAEGPVPPDADPEPDGEEPQDPPAEGGARESGEPREARAMAGGHAFAAADLLDLQVEALALRTARLAGQPIDPAEIQAAILDSGSAQEMLDRLGRLELRTGFAVAVAESRMAALRAGAEAVSDGE